MKRFMLVKIGLPSNGRSTAKTLRALEGENAKLKKVLAEQTLDNVILEDGDLAIRMTVRSIWLASPENPFAIRILETGAMIDANATGIGAPVDAVRTFNAEAGGAGAVVGYRREYPARRSSGALLVSFGIIRRRPLGVMAMRAARRAAVSL